MAIIDEPGAHLMQVTETSWLERAYARQKLHRILPARLGVAAAAAVGRRDWRDPERQDRARQWARSLLESSSEGDIDCLARNALIEERVKNELFWRPEIAWRARVGGVGALQDAVRRGGAIVSPLHVGSMTSLVEALLALGFPLFITAARRPADIKRPTGYGGLRQREFMTRVERRGGRFVGRGGAFPVVRALLESGEVCLMPFDAGGNRETAVGPWEAMLSSGAAELAAATGVPIFPAYALRRGHELELALLEPLRPERFKGAEELHDAVAHVLGDVMKENLSQRYPHPLPTRELAAERRTAKETKLRARAAARGAD